MSASAAFPRQARVRTPADYIAVFKNARRLAHPLMTLHLLKHGEAPRLGLAVSRKVDPRAVGRNRIKRVLRDCFRHARPQLLPGDYVLVLRPGAAAVDAPTLRAVMHDLLRRAGALSPSPADGTMPPASPTQHATHAAASLPSDLS